MKYIVIILTFLSASLALYSQDSEPEPFKFDYGKFGNQKTIIIWEEC